MRLWRGKDGAPVIRVAHLSDSHFYEGGRLQDVIDVHRAFVRECAARQVELILHAGDFFERASTPAERRALADFLIEASEVAPVFGVKGNHDRPLELAVFNRLAGVNRIQIVDRPGVYVLREVFGVPMAVVALPWFDKAHLASQVDAATSAEQTRALTIETAHGLLSVLRAEVAQMRASERISVFCGHVMVAGSEVSSGQTLIGTSVELSPSDIAGLGCSYAALGHVHKTQEWYEGRVAYSGSPHRCNFGEPEAKGFRLVTLAENDGRFVSNEFVELPARRMVLLEADWTGVQNIAIEPNTFALSAKREVEGARVRFRYRIRAQDLHQVDEGVLRKVFEADGAAEVQLEAVVETQARARAPEIVEARSTWEKVATWLDAKGIDARPADADRLRSKLAELEAK